MNATRILIVKATLGNWMLCAVKANLGTVKEHADPTVVLVSIVLQMAIAVAGKNAVKIPNALTTHIVRAAIQIPSALLPSIVVREDPTSMYVGEVVALRNVRRMRTAVDQGNIVVKVPEYAGKVASGKIAPTTAIAELLANIVNRTINVLKKLLQKFHQLRLHLRLL